MNEKELERKMFPALVNDIQQLQSENTKLRAEIIALEGVAEIMDCGHERRFSTLQIGATGNESTCALCENARLKSQIVHVDQLRLKEIERLRAALENIASAHFEEMDQVYAITRIAQEALKGGAE